MLIGDNITIRTVHGLEDIDLQKIRAFLQGARDFIGGDNYYWEHYPLGVLYFRHINAGYGHEYAFDQAAKDAGKILKGVLQDDNRVFETEGGYTRRYRWKNQ